MILYKIILIILGTISLGLGILGILVPGLPTTPFLLLTAALYVRGSERLYKKLITTPYIGPYIIRYRNRNGMTRSEKIYSIIVMWIMIILSTVFFLKTVPSRILVLSLGIAGTIIMGFVINTVRNDTDSSEKDV